VGRASGNLLTRLTRLAAASFSGAAAFNGAKLSGSEGMLSESSLLRVAGLVLQG